MTLVAGLDFETSGLDPVKDRIVEIGAVLWHWEDKIPMQLQSDLIFHDDLYLSEEITTIHGITDQMLSQLGRLEEGCFTDLNAIVGHAEHVFAHYGADFDRKFYEATCARIEAPVSIDSWIDTSIDLVYPESMKTRNLRHLAAEHGFLNPFSHRAVFDVLTMLKIAGCYDLEQMVTRSREPIIFLQAIVSFNDNQKAKDRGYRWCPPKKTWWKSFKQSDVRRERSEANFETSLLPWTERPE